MKKAEDLTNDDLIEYFDFIILTAKQEDDLNAVKLLFEHKLDKTVIQDQILGLNLSGRLTDWAVKRDLISLYPNGNWNLTQKGSDVREKGGYRKYTESLKPKVDAWRKTEVITAVFAAVISVVSLYLSWRNNDELSSLKDKVEANSRLQAQFETQVDSLSSEFYSLKTKMLSDSIAQ